MKLTLVSERPAVGNVRANLETIAQRTREATGDLVVFGELFLQGYMARDAHTRLAVSVEGEEFDGLKKLARETKKNLAVGFTRRDDERRGIIYDSVAIVSKKGKVETYDKWFPANFGPFEEKLYFAQGNRLGLVDVDGVKVGLQICYDIFFPELTKAYAVMGADLLLNVSASPTTSRPSFEPLFPARALETGCYFAYCNLAGSEDDIVFWGGSQVWGPRGDLKARAAYVEPSVLDVEIAMEELEAARPLRPTVRDTRKDMADALRRSIDDLGK